MALDLETIIDALRAEKGRLDRVIASIEELTGTTGHRRGRKSMSAEERQEVSERMKRYWAKRLSRKAPKTDKLRPCGSKVLAVRLQRYCPPFRWSLSPKGYATVI
jgi:hypothetical protein